LNWRVKLNGVDITHYVSGVQTRFEADNICGECEVALASRAPIAGIVVPRVPQSLSITAEEYKDGAWLSRGEYFLEQIEYPQDLDAKTAQIWGRSWTARLTAPWAQKISKQWPGGNTVAGIIAEVAAMAGVTVNVTNDYDVCQYCYAVSDQTPAEIIRDLATRSGQILWPEIDGTLTVAPRLYRDLPAPVITLVADEIVVESVDRTVPDFGNRILVSGDASVAGLSVQVVPLADEDACVAADGVSSVRLIAIVLGVDGPPVALGTVVTWSASSGLMSAETSLTQEVVRQAEAHQADNYTHVTLDLPAESVIGVYARRDVRRTNNLYAQRGGSVSGRTITFEYALDYYDQAVFVDYVVAGAPITWTAGWVPGDVTVLASVAGAQGFCTLHQSNPTACATQISMEAYPSSPCLGEAVTILLKTAMFGGAGVGSALFALSGCGSLSATRKVLQPRTITETLRTSIWGGAAEVRLSAIPVEGTTPVVYLAGTTATNLYASHNGQTLILNNSSILPGTQVDVTYVAGGTAVVTWTPSSIPSGYESISETLLVTHAGTAPDIVGQVTLTRTPVAAPVCVPVSEIGDFYASHDVKVVTLDDDPFTGEPLPIGTQVQCSYQSVWGSQPGCSATITVRVEDGSEDGGRGQIDVNARDCRTVNPSTGDGSTYDPEDPEQIPDELPADEDGLDDSSIFLPDEPDDPEYDPLTDCGADAINARTPNITKDNWGVVSGVGSAENCPGTCSCDEICAALRSKGRLADAGEFYSTCVAKCNDARDAKCTTCVLTGPATLEPGVTGVWDDGKGNLAELKGGTALALVSKSSAGYVLRMPTGGQGPFMITVCYGEESESCCEAQVDFPPCTPEGPTLLEPGAEGTYVPSLGMAGASVVCSGEVVFVRNLPYDAGFVAKMNEDACDGGTVTVTYSGRVCGTLTVESTLKSFVGYVAGPTMMDPGEMAYFGHNLGPGATYTGTLVLGDGGIGADGATLIMPSSAEYGDTYIASWDGAMCGQSASVTVTVTPDCALEYDTICPWGGYGAGTAPGISGRILLLDYSGTGTNRVATVGSLYQTRRAGTCADGSSAGQWRCFYISGVGNVMGICSGDGTSGAVYLISANPEMC
jgi:hypothetical protein